MTHPQPRGHAAPTPDQVAAVVGGPRTTEDDIEASLRRLVADGLLVEVAPGMYRLTPAGKARAETLIYGSPLS